MIRSCVARSEARSLSAASFTSRTKSDFGYNNVKSYESIRRMWSEIASVDGLVAREFQSFYSGGDDAATDVVRKALHKAKDRKDVFASNYEIYLAIFQLDKKRVQALNTDRNLIPVLRLLHTPHGCSGLLP